MKVVLLEGTPEEIKEVAQLFMNMPDVEISPALGVENIVKVETKPVVDPVEAMRAMLNRRPISRGQLTVYKTLGEDRLEHSEYLKRIGRTPKQAGGLHSALARRLDNTPEIKQAGLPRGYESVLTYTRDKEDSKEYWSLTPHAIEALKEEGIL